MKPAANKPDRETLRRLYEDERKPTREIGAKYGVAHITIRRWLTQYGIATRPSGGGTANRGIAMPTADQLHELVHVQHLGYRQIAAIYGVDFTAIPYWLDRYGIERPTVWGTRRKGKSPRLPSIDELRHRRKLGETVTSIAASCGVSRWAIVELCRNNAIEIDKNGWKKGRRYACRDGHQARSVYEQRVDDWLTAHGISHEVEPVYPFDKRCRADFLIGNTFVEIWGVTDNAAYQERKQRKIRLCVANGLKLIQINHWQFAAGRRWWRPLEPLLENPRAEQTQCCDSAGNITVEGGSHESMGRHSAGPILQIDAV